MNVLRLLIALILLLPLFAQRPAYPAPRLHRTLNIGYLASPTGPDSPEQQLHLYSRRYLSEISRRTNWQYVFLPIPAGQELDMLRSGAIDLYYPVPNDIPTPGFLKSEGYATYVLLSLYGAKENATAQSNDPSTLSGCKIGCLASGDGLKTLNHFLAAQSLRATVLTYPDPVSLLAAFSRGEIDFFLFHENPIPDQAQKSFSICIEPANFLATEENAPLMKELQDSILSISLTDPGFETRMESIYYDKAQADILYYTAAEHNFLDAAPAIRFAVPEGAVPYFTELKGTIGGILPDTLDILHKDIKLSFRYQEVPTAKKGFDLMSDGELDAVFCVYSNTDWAQDFYITNSFTFVPMTLIVQKDVDALPSAPRVVLPDWFGGAPEYLAIVHPNWNISVVTSPEECFRAILDKKYDAALMPSLFLQRTTPLSRYPELKSLDGMNIRLPISIALSPKYPDAKLLQSVLSKATLKIDQARADEIATKNLAKPMDTWLYIKSNDDILFAIVGAVVILLLVTVMVIQRFLYNKRKNRELSEKNAELNRAIARQSELQESRDTYKHQAETDALTGLYDKAAMVRLATEVLAEPLEEGTFHALFVMDLDHFKELNDTYGHQAGDKALIDFAQGLKTLFRDSDYAARFGGDEFVILMRGLQDLGTLPSRARAILELAKSIPQPDGKHILTASIGIAMAPQDGTTYDALFAAADAALYWVKRYGRGNYRMAG